MAMIVFDIIEATGLEIAALKAKNIEELEECITYISQNYLGPLCESEWVPQIIHRFHNPLPWTGEVILTNILEELSEFYILEDFQELKHT